MSNNIKLRSVQYFFVILFLLLIYLGRNKVKGNKEAENMFLSFI